MPRELSTVSGMEAAAIVAMKAPSITAPKVNLKRDSMPSFSSKPDTNCAASTRASSPARRRIPKTFAPSQIVIPVTTTTYGAALTKKVTNVMPAALPTMMLGTELINVSSPPTLVSRPSIRRNPSSLSPIPSRLSDTAVSDPTMIMAVTLLRTAEKATVITP